VTQIGLHTNGSNFLLTDGHVKWLMPTVVSPGHIAGAASNPQDTVNYKACGTGDLSSGGFAATFSPL
jgi:prepilin-type processing-associated H-X9-DG protein